jgi:hypothetical protein
MSWVALLAAIWLVVVLLGELYRELFGYSRHRGSSGELGGRWYRLDETAPLETSALVHSIEAYEQEHALMNEPKLKIERRHAYRLRDGKNVRLPDVHDQDGQLSLPRLRELVFGEGVDVAASIRAKALRVIVQFYTRREAVPILIDALSHPVPKVRNTAIFQLSVMGYPLSLESLIASCQTDEQMAWLVEIFSGVAVEHKEAIIEKIAHHNGFHALASLRVLERKTVSPILRRKIAEAIGIVEAAQHMNRGMLTVVADTQDGGLSIEQQAGRMSVFSDADDA